MQQSPATAFRDTAPRYTSYPTAPHFHDGITADTVAGWLRSMPEGDAVSLYLHVPFCDRLCWFCACHTKQTRRYEPVSAFLQSLGVEIELLAGLVKARAPTIRAVHFGGGSPTMLRPDDLRALMNRLRSSLPIAADASVSVEIDPNDMDEARLDALADIGLTRASLGIQDFDAKVQAAINREQSFERTRGVVEGLRARGIGSVNLDLLYGLPHQTLATLRSTLDQALSLTPDRLAIFGYAHVPWFKKHQTMIDEEWLPDPAARLDQARMAAACIVEAGYAAIGIDHFARPTDSLARAAVEGRLRRNFQGYSDEACETLIGLGPSSVSRYRQGYAQNTTATPTYVRSVKDGQLPVARGIAFDEDDLIRGWVIERLMCDFGFSVSALTELHGPAARPLVAKAEELSRTVMPTMLCRKGDCFVVPDAARTYVRVVAAEFDRYLAGGTARHSLAV